MKLHFPASDGRDTADTCIEVDAPSRLHLGFLDPNASLGRRFASLGLVIDAFATRLERFPQLSLAGTPERRPTFTLRGLETLPVFLT